MAVRETVTRYSWVALGLAFLAQWSNALSIQAVAPLAPLFQPELGLSKLEVGFFASAVFAGSSLVLLVAGTMTDRFGIRFMMSLGQFLAGLFLLAMSMVAAFPQAVLVMFAVGMGGGALLPAVTKSIVEWFPPRARATAMGIKQAAVPVGGILTASTLPALGLALGWRSAIGAVGFLVIAGGAVTLSQYREARPAGTLSGRGPSVGAGVREVVMNRDLWTLSATAILLVSAQLALITYLALYMKEVVLVPVIDDENARIVAAGGYLALCQLGGAFGRVLWGLFSDRYFPGRRRVVLAIVGTVAALMAAVVAFLSTSLPLWLLTMVVLLYGGTSIGWNGVYHTLVAETVGRKYAGTGVGLSMTLNQLGTVGGPPLFGVVVDLAGSYQMAWLLMACLSLAGAMVAAITSRSETHIA